MRSVYVCLPYHGHDWFNNPVALVSALDCHPHSDGDAIEIVYDDDNNIVSVSVCQTEEK